MLRYGCRPVSSRPASPTLLHRTAGVVAAFAWCAALGVFGQLEFGRVGSWPEAVALVATLWGGSCVGSALVRGGRGQTLGWLALAAAAAAAVAAMLGSPVVVPPATALALGLAGGQVAAAIQGGWMVALGCAAAWAAAAALPELVSRAPAGAVAVLPIATLGVAVAIGVRRVEWARPTAVASRWGMGLALLAASLGAVRLSQPPVGAAVGPWLAAAAVPAAFAFACARPWCGLLGVAVAAASFGPWAAAPSLPATWRLLAAEGRFAAAYDRSDQSMRVLKNGQVVARSGPDLPVEAAAATVVRALVGESGRTLVLGRGVGRWSRALADARLPLAQVVDVHDLPPAVLRATRAVGPVRLPSTEATEACVPALTRLARLAADSRAAIVVGDLPGEHGGWQLTPLGQRALRRVVGAGIVVQPFDLDGTDVAHLRGLLAAAAAAHPWSAVLRLGDLGLLVSAAAPCFEAGAPEAAWRQWPTTARWLAHEAHLGEFADLSAALVGRVAPWLADRARGIDDVPPRREGAAREAAAAALAECLVLADRLADAEPTHFAWWRRTDAELRLAVAKLRDLDAARAAQAIGIASPWLPLGAPRAELQAALGLPGGDGEPLADPASAALRAHAIDPTCRERLPAPFAKLPLVKQAVGDLEDLAELPAPERLAVIAVGRSPRAVALRARFGSAVARGLVALLAERPLQGDEFEALRELADPFVLRELLAVLAPRDRLAEAVGYWRGDVPLPRELRAMAAREPLPLVSVLARRTDAASRDVLAEILVDGAPEVRRAVAAALAAGPYAWLDYRPDGPPEARKDAAARLRAWHDRGP